MGRSAISEGQLELIAGVAEHLSTDLRPDGRKVPWAFQPFGRGENRDDVHVRVLVSVVEADPETELVAADDYASDGCSNLQAVSLLDDGRRSGVVHIPLRTHRASVSLRVHSGTLGQPSVS